MRQPDVEGLNLEPQPPIAYPFTDALDPSSSKGPPTSAEVQSLIYQTVPLAKLPREEAITFCKQLYSPNERFALGFYRYWREILGMPEKEAWQATLDELNEYVNKLIDNLADQRYHTIGFNQQGQYIPAGLYGFRALNDHEAGRKLIDSLKARNILDQYRGGLSIAHSFSALNGYRNRVLMKYAFLCIALEALDQGFHHIFFFMSDHRLGAIYRRFGLDFPPDLKFQDSQHLVGCYSMTPQHLEDIKHVCDQFGVPHPKALQSETPV